LKSRNRPSKKRAVPARFRPRKPSKAWIPPPDPRFCLACGGPLHRRYVVAEKRERLVCERCGVITYENPKIVAAALPLRDGKVFLLKRNTEPGFGLWTFPAGFMEMGETVEDAARRETREEINAAIELTGLQGIYAYPDTGIVTVVYRARVVGPAPHPGEEAQAVRAFRPGAIPWNDLAFRSTFEALRDWLAPEEPREKTPRLPG